MDASPVQMRGPHGEVPSFHIRPQNSIPTENIWQFMRDNWLSNWVFTSYENLIDHCCFARNKLIDQPWRIMSIGKRDWAHEF